MKDITIEEISDIVSNRLQLKIPKRITRAIARHFFRYIFKKLIPTKRDRLIIRECSLLSIYRDYDVEHICQQLAEDNPRIMTYTELVQRKTVSKNQKKYIKTPMFHLMPEK